MPDVADLPRPGAFDAPLLEAPKTYQTLRDERTALLKPGAQWNPEAIRAWHQYVTFRRIGFQMGRMEMRSLGAQVPNNPSIRRDLAGNEGFDNCVELLRHLTLQGQQRYLRIAALTPAGTPAVHNEAARQEAIQRQVGDLLRKETEQYQLTMMRTLTDEVERDGTARDAQQRAVRTYYEGRGQAVPANVGAEAWWEQTAQRRDAMTLEHDGLVNYGNTELANLDRILRDLAFALRRNNVADRDQAFTELTQWIAVADAFLGRHGRDEAHPDRHVSGFFHPRVFEARQAVSNFTDQHRGNRNGIRVEDVVTLMRDHMPVTPVESYVLAGEKLVNAISAMRDSNEVNAELRTRLAGEVHAMLMEILRVLHALIQESSGAPLRRTTLQGGIPADVKPRRFGRIAGLQEAQSAYAQKVTIGAAQFMAGLRESSGLTFQQVLRNVALPFIEVYRHLLGGLEQLLAGQNQQRGAVQPREAGGILRGHGRPAIIAKLEEDFAILQEALKPEHSRIPPDSDVQWRESRSHEQMQAIHQRAQAAPRIRAEEVLRELQRNDPAAVAEFRARLDHQMKEDIGDFDTADTAMIQELQRGGTEARDVAERIDKSGDNIRDAINAALQSLLFKILLIVGGVLGGIAAVKWTLRKARRKILPTADEKKLDQVAKSIAALQAAATDGAPSAAQLAKLSAQLEQVQPHLVTLQQLVAQLSAGTVVDPKQLAEFQATLGKLDAAVGFLCSSLGVMQKDIDAHAAKQAGEEAPVDGVPSSSVPPLAGEPLAVVPPAPPDGPKEP